MVKFDNLNDVTHKFVKTLCMFENVPVVVQGAHNDPEGTFGEDFLLSVLTLDGVAKLVKLTDPALNYKEYNLGYANAKPVAPWWFRKPHKQYQQGLRHNQMDCFLSSQNVHIEGFAFTDPIVKMLKNEYPDLESCRKSLVTGQTITIAFHKDFALTLDDMHDDFILEYRGKKIGTSIGPDLTKYKIKPDHKYLNEALEEALLSVRR